MAADAHAGEAMHWDIPPADSYAGYLTLDRLLTAQHPRSPEHDEMLFIVIHQASELWMKLMLHELAAAIGGIRDDALDVPLKVLARIGRIQLQLIQSWDVLATMTPADYVRLRPYLGTSSGFQSAQYRQIEFTLGNKDRKLIAVHRNDPPRHAQLEQALRAPSLYDEALRLLVRRGIAPLPHLAGRDPEAAYEAHPDVEAAWMVVYRDVDRYWDLYDLAEKLVDLEDRFQQWRFRHVKTVERIIGMKGGTGGSSGVPYLTRVLGLRFFPELWSVRTAV